MSILSVSSSSSSCSSSLSAAGHCEAAHTRQTCTSFFARLSVPYPKNYKNRNNKYEKVSATKLTLTLLGFRVKAEPLVFDDTIFMPFQARGRARHPISFRAQYMLSPSTNLLDVEELRLPSLQVHSDSLIANQPWAYTGTIGPPDEAIYGAPLPTETLLTSEEAVIAAAAAEAVTLAKAALKVAKDVALLFSKAESSSPVSRDANAFQVKWSQHQETEQTLRIKDTMSADTPLVDDNFIQFAIKESEDVVPENEEFGILQEKLSNSIAARSSRQTERKARRARAAEKSAASVVSVKSGSTSRKKRASLQDVDHSDPLRYLRATTHTSRLLTATEEIELSEGIQYKDVALLFSKAESSSPVSRDANAFQVKWSQHQETEQTLRIKDTMSADTPLVDDNFIQFAIKESEDVVPENEEFGILQEKLSNSIAARSSRQTERKARRARAAEKSAASVVSVKSGSTSRKKRASLQDVDHSDPLRYLRATTHTSRLLTATEEIELSEGIQELLKLEKLQEDLAQRCGSQPTFAQWAAAAGVDQKTLRRRVNYGILCKDKMIKSNIRLVISIAKNYQGAGMNLQDLVQEGCRGLVRGAEKFDATKGFKFSTYAHWWIKQAVRKSLSDQSRTIRLPFHMVEATYRVREAKKQLYSLNGRHPNDEEVAEATGLSMKRLAAVLLTPKAPRSLEQKIGINQNLKPSEVIADPDAETAEDLLMKKFMKQDLEKVLDSLNPREKQVIRWRFGMEDGRMKTLQEIGELMGVSRERIRQIESCAFRKLKNKRRTKHLQQYVLS